MALAITIWEYMVPQVPTWQIAASSIFSFLTVETERLFMEYELMVGSRNHNSVGFVVFLRYTFTKLNSIESSSLHCCISPDSFGIIRMILTKTGKLFKLVFWSWHFIESHTCSSPLLSWNNLSMLLKFSYIPSCAKVHFILASIVDLFINMLQVTY